MKPSSYPGVAGGAAAWMVMLLAVAALGSAPSAYASVSGCNATELAIAISKDCIDAYEPMSTSCCSAILPTVDMVGCLCSVVDEPMIADSGTTSRALFRLYLGCGGKRRSGDKPYESCDDFSGRSAPSLPASPPPPMPKDMNSAPTNDHERLQIEISTEVGAWLCAVLCLIGEGYKVYKWFKHGRTATVNSRTLPAVNNVSIRDPSPVNNSNGQRSEGNSTAQGTPPDGTELAAMTPSGPTQQEDKSSVLALAIST